MTTGPPIPDTAHRSPSIPPPTGGVLAVADDDVDEISENALDAWQIRELFSVLRGDQRLWAEAYYDAIGHLKPGAQPRGLHKDLRWTQSKTDKTAQRARAKMVAFALRRASGAVCEEQCALLDSFIATTGLKAARTPGLDQEQFEQVLFHIAGCADCRVAFRARRRAVAPHAAILTFPLEALAGAWQALGERLAGGAARVGLGGGAVATGGAAATTMTTKGVVACVAAVCAAGAVQSTGVMPELPPLLPKERVTVKAPAPAARIAPAARPAIATAPATRVTVPPPPPPPARRPTKPKRCSTSTRSASPANSATSTSPPATARFTPGDLPPASSTQSSGTPPPPPAATAVKQPTCTPGDVGC
jgi:hypothetical protein